MIYKIIMALIMNLTFCHICKMGRVLATIYGYKGLLRLHHKMMSDSVYKSFFNARAMFLAKFEEKEIERIYTKITIINHQICSFSFSNQFRIIILLNDFRFNMLSQKFFLEHAR